MFRKLLSVKASAWALLGLAFGAALGSRVAMQANWVDAHTALYVVQPILLVVAALSAWYMLHGQRDRVRHKGDKMLTIASAMSVWFVMYFLSGMIFTFVHNALSSSWQNIVMNTAVFVISALSVEYIRYSLMLLAGRRSALQFGVLVSLVFAVQQISLLQISDTAWVDIIKFVITYVVPALVASFLLSYLSLVAGFGSQLVYSLGIVALTVLPPIIPKYDWYMTSMTSILLALAVYIMVDRGRGISDEERTRRRKRHPRLAFDITFGVVMVALVLFMTGAFTYKPVVIMSNSMVPVFSRGSIVVVQQIHSPMDIKMGDIIQYVSENKTITHRVVAIDTAEDDTGDLVFTTKGDNNPSRDPPVSQSHVIGIIRATVPYVGYPTVWLKELPQHT